MSFMDLPPEEDLLAEQAALRRMAAGLVRDDSTADDLVQEAWVAAAESPNRIENLRAWMRQVLRNFAGQLRRKRERDRHYERAAAQGESLEPVDEELSREQLFEELAFALSRLREPLRTVVYLRFYEGLGPKAIAERLGRPTDTVKSQLKKGIEELRECMERRIGRNWAPALVLLARDPGAGAMRRAAPLRSLVTQPLTWLVLLVGVAVYWVFGAGTSSPERAPDIDVVAADARAEDGETLALSVEGESRAAAEPAPAVEAPAAVQDVPGPPPLSAEEPGYDIEVRAVDQGGAPVAGAPLALQSKDGFEVLGETGADGRASVRIPRRLTGRSQLFPDHERAALLRVQMPGRATLCEMRLGLRAEQTLSLEVPVGGPCATIRGVVSGAGGRPVEGVQFVLRNYEGSVEFAPVGEGVVRSTYDGKGWTDAEGRFQLDFVDPGRWSIEFLHPKFPETLREVHVEAGEVLDLEVPMEIGGTVAGTVLDGEGAPVAGATVYQYNVVTAETKETTSAPDGRYRLEGLLAGTVRVWARAPDRPEVLDFEELVVPEGRAVEWDPSLAPRPGLRLRLVTPDGAPLFNAFVIAAASNGSKRWVRREFSDERGGVHIPDCPGWEMEVYVLTSLERNSTPKVQLNGVLPSDEVRELVVGAASPQTGFTGLLVAHDGRPISGGMLGYRLQSSEVSNRAALRPDGSFVVHGLLPGSYVLSADFDERGLVVLNDSCLVEPGVVVDVGELRVPAQGFVEVEWGWPAEEGLEWELHTLVDHAGVMRERLMKRGPAPPPKAFDLYPGPFTLDVLRGGVRTARFPFVLEGAEARLRVRR